MCNGTGASTVQTVRTAPRVSGKRTQEALKAAERKRERGPMRVKQPAEARQVVAGEIPTEKMFEGLRPEHNTARNRAAIKGYTDDHNRLTRGLANMAESPETNQVRASLQRQLDAVDNSIGHIKTTGKA